MLLRQYFIIVFCCPTAKCQRRVVLGLQLGSPRGAKAGVRRSVIENVTAEVVLLPCGRLPGLPKSRCA